MSRSPATPPVAGAGGKAAAGGAAVVTPGEALRPLDGFEAGAGTYVRAPLAGTRTAAPTEPEYAGGRMYEAGRPRRGGAGPPPADAPPYLAGSVVCSALVGAPSVKRQGGGGPAVVAVRPGAHAGTRRRPSGVPRVGDACLGRVARVTARSVLVEIVVSGGKVLGSSLFRGLLRKEDVRDREQDELDLQQLFLPGDVVKSVVLSLGDGRVLQLGTSTAGCGVVGKAEGERLATTDDVE